MYRCTRACNPAVDGGCLPCLHSTLFINAWSFNFKLDGLAQGFHLCLLNVEITGSRDAIPAFMWVPEVGVTDLRLSPLSHLPLGAFC